MCQSKVATTNGHKMPQQGSNKNRPKSLCTPNSTLLYPNNKNKKKNMSNMQQTFNAGQTHGQTQAKAEEWMQSIKTSANEARSDRTDNSAHSAHSAQQGKEEAAGFLQQTGEQMVHMAQGAVDSVKNTLGMGDKK